MKWDDVLTQMASWQKRQFPLTTTEGARNHLKKEVLKELEENPDDPEEWADALFMSIQGGTLASGGLHKFLDMVADKLKKNSERQWPDKPDADNVYEHIK